MANRDVVKRDMIVLRRQMFGGVGYRNKYCRCDMCQERPGTEMHEIYSRGRTRNDEYRDVIYQEQLCSILCSECHRIAHNKEGREKLVKRNCTIYGDSTVRQCANKLPVPSVITRHIPE